MGTLSLHFLQPQPRLPLQYKQQILSLHQNLGFLQQILEKSETAYDDVEAEIRDAAFEAEERIEMELTTIYLAKGWTKSLACLRLHGIFIQVVIQTDYLKKKFIKISEKQLAKVPSQGERMPQRGLLHGSTSSQPDLEQARHENLLNVIGDENFPFLREAQHENLLNIIGDEKLPFYKKKISCRWIRAASGFDLLPLTKCFHKSHSLHYPYGVYSYNSESVERLFSHFKLLRVVDIEWMCSYGFRVLNALANLIHLRYLALRNLRNLVFNGTEYFDLELFEYWNIQSFIICGDDVTLNFSKASGICKMPLLRNICIERIVSLGTLPVVHRNLESISWLHPKLCTKDLFTRIPNLKKLGIDGGVDENNLDCFYNFVHLGQLEKLSIRKWHSLNRIQFHVAASHGQLVFYQILRSSSSWILICHGMLCGLLNVGAIQGRVPSIEKMELRHCLSLQEIPSGFADIITLALIQLSWCLDSVLASAKLIQEEQYNYGNALLVHTKRVNNSQSNRKEWDVEEESDLLGGIGAAKPYGNDCLCVRSKNTTYVENWKSIIQWQRRTFIAPATIPSIGARGSTLLSSSPKYLAEAVAIRDVLSWGEDEGRYQGEASSGNRCTVGWVQALSNDTMTSSSLLSYLS
nr:putative late blight resistance protein homolog R1A-10 isoform X1 [Ipomoea batatas]